MNIMYCGDSNTIDGLIISLLSIVKHVKTKLNIYILTMDFESHKSLTKEHIEVLEKIVKDVNNNSFVKRIDAKSYYETCIPIANIDTRFTPYCMLRLYADLIPELPDKILYLDYDVVCNKDFTNLYNTDITEHEIVGALDYYGSHIYRKKLWQKDYLNSGVLLINLELIKETNLFAKCRNLCKERKMLLPDQTALNFLSKTKLIVDRKYNEQKDMEEDTVFRHFSTTFRFFPYIKTQSIKPWNIEMLHKVLKTYCFDDIIEKYKVLKESIK